MGLFSRTTASGLFNYLDNPPIAGQHELLTAWAEELFFTTRWVDVPSLTMRAVLDQPYNLTGDMMVAAMEQRYAFTERRQALLYQVYGLRLLTALTQWYGDVSALRARIDQWYGDAATLRRSCGQRYGDALALRQLVDQDWTMPAGLRAVLAQLFSMAGERLQGLAEQRYSLQEYAALRARLDQLWILPPGAALVQRPVISMTADGVAIDPHHISIDIDEADYAIRGEIHVADQAHFLRCRHMATELLITIDADVYRVVVDSPRRSRPETARTEYYVPFASPTVRLDAPYAATISREFAGAMASVIVTELAAIGGITVDWQLVDWYLPPATLYANNETPLAVIRKVVEAVGGILQTSPAGVLICRPEYPVSVNAWVTAAPDFWLTDMDNFFSVDSTPSIREGYNRFAVSNQAAAAAGLTLEQKDIDATTKEILVYQVPWDDAAVIRLRTSGGEWVSIVSEGVVTEVLTDQLVEIIAGEGHTAKPIAAMGTHVYKQAVLGAITAAEDGQITTEVVGNSLLEVTYTTRYRKFICTDARIEDVQFYPEEVAA
ncbi:MAG: hypothetical protein WC869_15805 [Phycisphaerae bacterium]|jgi:hypothetical protein